MKKILEKKYLLNGDIRVYNCELIYNNQSFGILKYILEKQYNVSGLILPQSSITFAFYWIYRPYTLYRWYHNKKNIGNYFNIADQIVLNDSEFEWRDIVVDVLYRSDDLPIILDEDELPTDMPDHLLEYIHSAKRQIIENYQDIITETDQFLKQYCNFFRSG
ncbi:DUF402 domain-containing protein [bacterium]|nr:DUF402 domain-containing protein [bacterium]MBU1065714.1 DUF402 domain-containing protein [bacterium]MBU1635457.1 DUF402 domain-containing protein [bacterium]MBU1874941.1 DUF402 domain-containing protein [bacterium]